MVFSRAGVQGGWGMPAGASHVFTAWLQMSSHFAFVSRYILGSFSEMRQILKL